MCASIAALTWLVGRLVTQEGSWFSQTRLCPRTRSPWEVAKLTIASPGPKLYEPLEGSMVSHFISFSGVTMLNWVPARLAAEELLRSPWPTATPKYRPLVAAAPPSVVAADALPASATTEPVATVTTATAAAASRMRSRRLLEDLISL